VGDGGEDALDDRFGVVDAVPIVAVGAAVPGDEVLRRAG
jgi:hypothetical protein